MLLQETLTLFHFHRYYINNQCSKRSGCYMRRAKHNIRSRTKATGSFL